MNFKPQVLASSRQKLPYRCGCQFAIMPPAAPPRKLISRDRAPSFFSSLKTKEYREHRNAKDSIRSIAWNNHGNRIACGLIDRLVRVWNPEKPEIRYTTELKGHSGAVEKIQWDPTHSDRLASASTDGTVRFWDYRSECWGYGRMTKSYRLW